MSCMGHINEGGEMGDMLTVAEAAALSGYSERHVRRLAEGGRVNGQRVGQRVYLIDKESLLAYVGEMKELGSEKHAPG